MSYLNFFGGTASAFSGALVKLSGNWTHAADEVVWEVEVYDEGNWHHNVTNPTRLTVPAGLSLVRMTGSCKSPNIPNVACTKNGAVMRGRVLQTSGIGTYLGGISAPLAVSASDYLEWLCSVDVTNEARSWAAIEKLDAALKYALVYRSTTLALSAGVAALVDFDSEVADTNAFHDTGTNPSRLTVPSGVTCVRLCANIDTSSASNLLRMTFLKAGSSFAGGSFVNQERSAVLALNMCSAPVEVSAGDYFQLSVLAVSARTLQSNEAVWFSIEEYPSTYQRVLTQKSASQSYTSGVEAAIQWDGADVYDTASMHNPASNNTRCVVPSGVTQARVSFCVITPSATGLQQVRCLKNGGTFDGMASYQSDVTGADTLAAISAWVNVTAGDYFECMLTTGANLTLAARVDMWMCLECR